MVNWAKLGWNTRIEVIFHETFSISHNGQFPRSHCTRTEELLEGNNLEQIIIPRGFIYIILYIHEI